MSSAKYNNTTKLTIGLVDADLLDNGTRHPNLVLLKIAGFLNDHGICFELILDPKTDVSKYDRIYLSRVFTFTAMPAFYEMAKGTPVQKKFVLGGTGFYADEPNIKIFAKKRTLDMNRLENDNFLNRFSNTKGGSCKFGIDMVRQMPYYHLYDNYVDKQVKLGFNRHKFKDYLYFSIGFLTRGCIRHCPFCINKLEATVRPHSKLEWFDDQEKDEKGHFIRKYIYLWDDNFLASDISVWKPLLQQLIDYGKPFQFRQGLDERVLALSPHGEEMAKMLSKSKYYGDFIFAFDNWRDRIIIEKALKIWKRYNPKKGTKFYLLCGFKQKKNDRESFYRDIWELFQRIRILMQYGCTVYIMRHQDYHNAPLSNLYIQIARWCNQVKFYKKMSFWEFSYRNQSYWEEHTLPPNGRPKLIKFEKFEQNIADGYYEHINMCPSLRSIVNILNMFPEQRNELLEMFNYKMSNLCNSEL